MTTTQERTAKRKRRHQRTRRKLNGTAARPRLAIHRTLSHIYAQIIDDDLSRTLCSASTRSAECKELAGKTGNCAAATKVGELIAERATQAGVSKVVFDRGGFLFHGRVKAVAEGARKGGLVF